MFFHPERMFAAWELTIWAIQRTTMSRMVGDLNGRQSKEVSDEAEGEAVKTKRKKNRKGGAKGSTQMKTQNRRNKVNKYLVYHIHSICSNILLYSLNLLFKDGSQSEAVLGYFHTNGLFTLVQIS